MRLIVDFNDLIAAVQQMGAQVRTIDIDLTLDGLEQIDIQLAAGIELDIDKVETLNGLLSYEGRQILLYIQDHGRKAPETLTDGSKGNKYHVGDCETLVKMKAKNRFQRYVATNDLTIDFYISGFEWDTRREVSGDAQLNVCKNCLDKLKYQGFEKGGHMNHIVEVFNIEEFFSTYSSFFKHMPSQFAGKNAKDNYVSDWPVISGKYKAAIKFTCEECHLSLSSHKNLLHVHHINGVKRDNKSSNLRALCIECHRKQPCHGHMFVSLKDRLILNRLRREQGKSDCKTWIDVYEHADPAVHGLVKICEKSKVTLPKVNYEISIGVNNKIEVPLAWLKNKVTVIINETDAEILAKNNWAVWRLTEAIDQFFGFKLKI